MNVEIDEHILHTQSRIEELLGQLRSKASPETVAQVEELVEHVVGLYGEALERVTSALANGEQRVSELRDALVGDHLVSSLLVLHGIHPEGLRARVERAIAKVSPYVASHGGKVVVLGVEEDLVGLRLEGACQSCASSSATAKDLLERAVLDAAPEVARVEVDTGAAAKAPAATGLVQLGLKRGKTSIDTPAEGEAGAHADAHEQCEMCAQPIGAAHEHVARVATRELLCVCRACRLLFAHDGAARGKYRPVSDRWVADASYGLTDLEWARLGIPVRMAFFVKDSSRGEPIGFYPSPGGIIEASIDPDAWSCMESATPALDALAPDVEAWLVDGRGRAGFDGWLVPLDACYELVARVRLHWSGFDGGDVARQKIDEFFANVRSRAAGSVLEGGWR